MKPVKLGVPQGSYLELVLFLLCINDIFNNFDIPPVLFADDTCLTVEATTTNELNDLLNFVVQKAKSWTNSNQLTINAAKSNILILSPSRKQTRKIDTVMCSDHPIALQKNVKYLGVKTDNKLEFTEHVQRVTHKILCSTGIICKLKPYFPKNILIQLYNALIYPYLMYGIPVWGSTVPIKHTFKKSHHTKTKS